MREQTRLLRQIRSYQFAAWELHMFLDTHPANREAAKKLHEVREKTAELVRKYEEQYGPINETNADTSRWAWITGPWPWEAGEEDED
ncbi:MAG: spore coat protein CotJB [Lachnospiraceae bacterium]|nr:spore coat protein CotJB [Lachnospiraceae bacterium]